MGIEEAAASALMRFNTRRTPPAYSESDRDLSIALPVVDVRTLSGHISIPEKHGCSSFVEAVIEHGFIPSTPVNPQFAISVSTLEFLHFLRAHQPSTSFQAFAKTICDLYQVSYWAHHRVAL